MRAVSIKDINMDGKNAIIKSYFDTYNLDACGRVFAHENTQYIDIGEDFRGYQNKLISNGAMFLFWNNCNIIQYNNFDWYW